MRLMILSSVLLGLVGCASAPGNLQRETARNLGIIAPEIVSVGNVQRSMTSVQWEAVTPERMYHCMADDMVRRVQCVAR